MIVQGVDFTSRPSRRKPITVATGRIEGDRIRLESLIGLTDLAAFERFLHEPGERTAGFDLPLGMPRALREWSGRDGPALAALAHGEGPNLLSTRLKGYRGPNGERELFRPCDRAARACSPMKTAFIPVGRMYARGAHPIRAAGWRIAGDGLGRGEKTAIEAYPALVAAALGPLGGPPDAYRSYKSDSSPKPEHRTRREAIIRGLGMPNPYGFVVTDLPADLADDPGADTLDAVLAMLQTAWAMGRDDLGVRSGTDPFEGAISDPALLGGTVPE